MSRFSSFSRPDQASLQTGRIHAASSRVRNAKPLLGLDELSENNQKDCSSKKITLKQSNGGKIVRKCKGVVVEC